VVLREFDVLLCTAMSKRATNQEVRQAFRRFADALVKTVYAFLREVVTLTPNPNPNPNPYPNPNPNPTPTPNPNQIVSYCNEGDPSDELCGVLSWALQSLATCRVTLDAEAYLRLGGGPGGGEALRRQLCTAVAREHSGMPRPRALRLPPASLAPLLLRFEQELHRGVLALAAVGQRNCDIIKEGLKYVKVLRSVHSSVK
jgi:hypothetical protein